MIVTIKTISGPSFEVEAEESDTVADLKDKVVSSSQGSSFVKESLILIHKGKVLKDVEILQEAGVLGSFCVAMQGKKATTTTAPKPTTGQSSSAPTDVPPTETTPTTTTPAPSQEPSAVETTPDTTTDDYTSRVSALATGSELEKNISQICEMGFEREQVVRAMHAAYNNPDRAVEYLTNGMPQISTPQQPPATGTPQVVGAQPAATPTESQQGPNTQPLNMFGSQATSGTGAETGTGGGLDFLRNNPQFQLLRQMVAQNPSVLHPMLQELGRSNPELLRQISEHQQEFLALLTEEPNAQVTEAAEGLMQLAGQGGEVAGGDPVYSTVTITPEEAAAIERLQSLGFDRDRCVEAYLICDKNEEIAANYLLEHADDN